ncbi:MAG: AAA family ATPase [Deltaproteobacteria bacterium]|nr:AAA family ATPase [Deltaproteobacteria bacterium]
MAATTTPAKITPPILSGVVQRRRLLTLLDRKTETPAVWLSSPAGSGKTKLVLSYLDARKFPSIWYRCDEGDSDLATFFYYMRIAARKAAPRHKDPLPLLTPEYADGISTFTRRYFEKFYDRLIPRHSSLSTPRVFFIILDNYQDVPAGSAFHDMMADGLDLIPEGVRVVVISRNDPPAVLSRLHANDHIGILEYSDIRFTLEETKRLLRSRLPRLDNRSMTAIYERTEGWAAGIILMLAGAGLRGKKTEPEEGFDYGRVFDYFAAEVFDKAGKEVQDFLLQTAFLPTLSVPSTEKLTGVSHAGHILSALNFHNFFTERLSGNGERYQYHPLFRDFLLNRVKTTSSPRQLAVMQRMAARLLEKSGQIEDAARLYSEAGEGKDLVRMVNRHAREYLRQGRNKTIAEWIAGIPARTAEDSWLLYWTGMCSFPFDMARTREYLEKAFELFKAGEDIPGIYLSWAGIVDACAFELDNWKHLDDWIAVFDGLRKIYPSFPSKEIDLIASSRMLIALILRKTDHPTWVFQWFDRVSALLQEGPSVDIQMDTVFFLSLYYLWEGEYQKNDILLEKADAEISHRRPSPFALIRIKLMKGIHYWVTARYDSALKTLSEGLGISRESGVHVFDSLFWSFSAAVEMVVGNREMAEKSIRNQMATAFDSNKTLDIFFYHINSAWHATLQGNLSLAAEKMEAVSAMTEKMGTPYYRALWNIGMAQVAFLQGRQREAKAHLRIALRTGRNMRSRVIEWYSLLTDAWFLLRKDREKKGIESLRRGLALGRRHGYVHLEFYQPSVMQFLCAKALEMAIEPEYVKGLIKKLGLMPPVNPAAPALSLETWPYPVKVYALGGFEIFKDDEALEFTGKVQKKPLEMLKLIIAFGGQNVPGEAVADVLWPEAEGDLAHKSFEMTLIRLRRLLGDDRSIRYGAGQLCLDPGCCWVDSLALEHALERTRKAPADQAAQLCEKVVGLYKGAFLPFDTNLPWVVNRRETLNNALLRAISTSGRHCERTGQWERAVEFYLQGLYVDPLAEEFYQRLMLCYQMQGKKAAAAKTFSRCRLLLQSHLGIEPSSETRKIYFSIVQ